MKGIDSVQKCDAEEITMLRFPAARCIVHRPKDSIFYLVSGDDGVIHKCSVNYFTQHVESFLAHLGPVYALKFSPFCDKVKQLFTFHLIKKYFLSQNYSFIMYKNIILSIIINYLFVSKVS